MHMKILMIGAGALGIGIGASIINGGISVDFFARGTTKKAIDTDGISRRGMFRDIEIPADKIATYDRYDKLPKQTYDYVIIATKTTANEEVALNLSQYRDCMAAGGRIIFMQNGFGYEEPFLRYFEQDILYHSRVITGFKKTTACDSVITAHQAPVLIGSLYGSDPVAVEPVVNAIQDSGIPAEIVDAEDLSKALWAKLIYNTTLNPLGAILGMSYGELADSEYAHSMMDILIEETFDIMYAAGGSTFWQNAEAYRHVLFEQMIPVTYEHRSSTLQDIEKGQKTEIDTLTGSLINLASQYNVAAPMHTVMYSLVKALEDKF